MADMVLQPRFDADEMNSEREVVLEEIAMYEDTPQDLVHDLIAQAVFGDHPLGRPVIGTERRDLERHARGRPRLPRRPLRRPEHRRRRRRQPRPRAAGARRRDTLCAAQPHPRPDGRRAAGVDGGGAAAVALPAEGHRAVPRRARRARAAALRPAPVRGVAARLDARGLGLVAPVPGDPRAARDGLLGLHLRVPVRGHRDGGRLPGHARGQPGGVPAHHRRPVPADGRGRLRDGRARRGRRRT